MGRDREGVIVWIKSKKKNTLSILTAEEKCTALFLCCLHMGYGSFNLSAPQIINDIFLADSRSVYMEQGVS